MKTRALISLLMFLMIIYTVTGCEPSDDIGKVDDPDDIDKEISYKQYDCILVDRCMCQPPIKLNINTDLYCTLPDISKIEGMPHTITLHDITLTGKLYITRCVSNLTPLFRYKCDDNSWFEIELTTGSIYTIDMSPSKQFKLSELGSEETDIGEEAAKEIADRYASEVINIPDYAVNISSISTHVTLDEMTADVKLYKIQYAKYYSGIITTDSVTITITSKGNFYSYSAVSPGAFESSTPDYFDLEKLHQAVDKEMENIFSGAGLQDFRYETEDVKVLTLKDHIWLDTDVYYYYTNSEGKTSEHIVSFFVVVK